MNENITLKAAREYAEKIARLRGGGNAREHAYRGDLQKLIETLVSGARAVNEGARVEGDAPDFRVEWESGAVLGYAETKDIGADLDKTENSPQLKRYRKRFSNLILTDYLEFRRYANGNLADSLKFAEDIVGGKITPPISKQRALRLGEFFGGFAEAGRGGETPSAESLARILAAKAREVQRCAAKALDEGDSDLTALHAAFAKNLMRGLKPKDFSDIFAQTAVYALFFARLEADEKGRAHQFSRETAGDLLPQTIPFLRKFFNQFMGRDLNSGLADAADNTADYLRAASMENIYKEFARRGGFDPFMHFYETFMMHYDGKQRREQGVYYTPPQVVDFIVRAADFCVQKYFPETPEGLAFDGKKENPRKEGEKYAVQILDPAAGTGAFLSKAVEIIKERKPENWEYYAAEALLPRLFGFENMMGAYAICHMKFARDFGGEIMKRLQRENGRVNIYLTDSLDYEKHPPMGIGWLDAEARAADLVKSEEPVMVVLGNPPYNVRSKNNSEHISKLLEDYKKNLHERKINLDDDYIKFIRNAEWLVAEQTGRGVVAFITNNSFYGGITHRKMREHLLRSFDEIYVLNLHGKTGETAPDGGIDKNVFDIQVGVGIIIMVKTAVSEHPAKLRYADLQGTRETKFDFLTRENMESVKWQTLSPSAPNYFFIPKDFSAKEEYEKGVLLTDLFSVYNSGIQTKRDSLTVHFTEDEIDAVIEDMQKLEAEKIRGKYNLPPDGRDWSVERAKKDVELGGAVESYAYRPFDIRKTFYTGRVKGFIAYPRHKIMRHFIGHENIGLIAPRLCKGQNGFEHGLVSKHIIDIAVGDAHSGSGTYVFPLWLYEEMHGELKRCPNFRAEIASEIATAAQTKYAEDGGTNCISPPEIFDYIYAVLHNPHYRKKYAEFLKIGFPRIPLPKNRAHFRQTAKTGGKLRRLHLLEDASLDGDGVIFDDGGGNVVEKIRAKPDGKKTLRVEIGAKSAFCGVPAAAWEFRIGGYFPAQKWLKSRKNRALKYEDLRHFRRTINALAQTAEIAEKMEEG